MTTRREAAGRKCILEQAQRLFFASGYHGVSIRDIVQACGLSNAALYHHFGSKQKLFIEVLAHYVGMAAQRVQLAGQGGGTCRERLTRMAQAHVQLMLESTSEVRALQRDLVEILGEERPLLTGIMEQGPVLYAPVLEEGIADGKVRPVDARRASAIFLGMINSAVARRLYDSDAGPLADDVELAVDILFEGIGA